MGTTKKRQRKLKERTQQKKVLVNKLEIAREALVAKIVKWDDPVLKVAAKESSSLSGNVAVSKDLKEILEATKDGVGIAANQIGSLHRVFITRPEFPNKDTVHTFINPTITRYSGEKVTAQEGCLSYPEHYCDVERNEKVIVDYTDIKGEKHTEEFTDWHARIIQHEFDHLNGDCLVGEDFYSKKEVGSSASRSSQSAVKAF